MTDETRITLTKENNFRQAIRNADGAVMSAIWRVGQRGHSPDGGLTIRVRVDGLDYDFEDRTFRFAAHTPKEKEEFAIATLESIVVADLIDEELTKLRDLIQIKLDGIQNMRDGIRAVEDRISKIENLR